MAQSKQDQMIEETLGTALIGFFFAVLSFFRCWWHGFTSFNNSMRIASYASKRIIFLLIVFILGTLFIDITIISVAIFIIFMFYMIVLGKKYQKNIDILEKEKEAKKERTIINFLSIGFKDKLGFTPELLNVEKINDYFENLIFRSNIPLEEWKKNKSKIQELFNTRIISINNDVVHSCLKIAKCSKLQEPMFVKFDKKYLSMDPYKIFIGLDIYGQPTYLNLFKNPHTIIAGSTNTGKSSNAFSFFTQLKQHKCNKIILCDFKKVTFKSLVKYNNNKQAITDKQEFIKMLEWSVKESKIRIEIFNQFDECENLKEYNDLVDDSKRLNNIFIFIDELAIVLKEKNQHIEDMLIELAQTGRSQGIYLLVFTQRPSVKTVPSEARANFTSRLSSFQVDKATSEMAVGDYSAAELPNIPGRCILKLGGQTVEVQAVFIEKKDLSKYLKIYDKKSLT